MMSFGFRPFCRVSLAISALLAVSCSSINRSWKASEGDGKSKDVFAGKWDGKWLSTSRQGEGGKLRCVFTPIDAHQYRAVFEAHWKVFSTSYTAVFQTERNGKELQFAGTHELPKVFGGVYHYQGRVTPDHFSATYSSSYDVGRFEMGRPQGEDVKIPQKQRSGS